MCLGSFQVLSCVSKSMVSRLRKVILPPAQPCSGTSGVLCPVLGCPVQRDMGVLERAWGLAMNILKGLEHLTHEERL